MTLIMRSLLRRDLEDKNLAAKLGDVREGAVALLYEFDTAVVLT